MAIFNVAGTCLASHKQKADYNSLIQKHDSKFSFCKAEKPGRLSDQDELFPLSSMGQVVLYIICRYFYVHLTNNRGISGKWVGLKDHGSGRTEYVQLTTDGFALSE